jgi:hypothetical protein
MQTPTSKRVFFYRDYQVFQGGHLKVWDYFQHVAACPPYQPLIFFSDTSRWDNSNPWTGAPDAWLLKEWQPEQADLLFLAGLDWQQVPVDNPTPTINLIQHVRHGEKGDPRREFLHRPALRICVSEDVRQAILATGLVNGPVVTIPNGLNLPPLEETPQKLSGTVLIAGMKNPAFARDLAKHLFEQGIRHELVVETLPRIEFLKKMAEVDVVVTLPHEREGFFLPALEAMGLGCLVICPDCVGNRDFCKDRINAYRPAYQLDEVLLATCAALRLGGSDKQCMLMESKKTAQQHHLSEERSTFHSHLRDFEKMWSSLLFNERGCYAVNSCK